MNKLLRFPEDLSSQTRNAFRLRGEFLFVLLVPEET